MTLQDLRQSKSPEQHRYHFLDALRGLAAIFVIQLHLPPAVQHYSLARSSYLAVDFFFCLSGFVVALSYQERLGSTLGFREFAVTRLIRLYPMAMLGSVLGAFMLLYDHTDLAWRSLPLYASVPYAVVSSLLILPLPKGLLFPLDFPLWTLFLELAVNMIFGAMMRWRLAISAVLICIAALSFVGLLHDHFRYGLFVYGFSSATFFAGVHRVGFSFTAGILLYRLYRRRRPARLHGVQAVAIAALGTGSLLFLFFSSGTAIRSHSLDLLSFVVGFPLLIYWGARIQLPSFTTKAFSALGALSYPLYILHVPLLVPLSWIHLQPGFLAGCTVYVYIGLLSILAWFVAMYVDVPVRRAVIRKLRGAKSSPALVTST